MNTILFEMFIWKLDMDMGKEGCDVVLLIDNFLGHFINYKPQNIELVYFTPNLTSHLQPLDAGIIQCFKALYRRFFCKRAIDLNNAGEENIFKINLLKAMHLAKRAWDEVRAEVIQNCWRHTGVVPEEANRAVEVSHTSPVHTLQDVAWNIIKAFASSTDMKLPDAEKALKAALKDEYWDEDWRKALALVNNTEEEESSVLATKLAELQRTTTRSSLSSTVHPTSGTTSTSPPSEALAAEQRMQEQELMKKVHELRTRNRIFNIPSVGNLLDNPKENLAGETKFTFEDDSEIIAQVHRDIEDAAETDSEGEFDDEPDIKPATSEQIIDLCCNTEAVGLADTDPLGAELAALARRFCGHVYQRTIRESRQTTLDAWTSKVIRKGS